ncbi:hypothetical protein DRF60_04960 [Chryseobacterium elymi]|uniref:T9SS C-terminal target domain-containing protein n=1 Tax=Chryseobacterium elymi TaxID=395936 RepID=A0A3D9DP28_9FLAO|nr:hypothetical protein [Chryseobacterium elymi]REC79754.1 hypothetical protein DRF60_04960 [Chryseobacterium elymi]
MKKNIILLGALVVSSLAYSQVGINNETPKATLDVSAKTPSTAAEGIIAPRLSGDDIKGKDGQYLADQKGAIVYATSAVGTPSVKTANITAEGYYYFDGTIWQKFSAANTEPWYDAATNTQATSNTQNIYQMGNVGIGTSDLGLSKLEVRDTIAATVTVPVGTAYSGTNSLLYLNNSEPTVAQSYRAAQLNLNIVPGNTSNYQNYLFGTRTGVNHQGSGHMTHISGINNVNILGTSSGTAGIFYGTNNEMQIFSGQADNIAVMYSKLNIRPTSTIKQPLGYGSHLNLDSKGAGIADYFGYSASVVSGSIVDKFYGYYVHPSAETLTNTSATSEKWAFYNDAAIPSYFKGYVGIGTTTPGRPLEIERTTTGGPNSGIMLTEYVGTVGNKGAQINLRSSRGSKGGEQPLQNGDVIASYLFDYYSPTGFTNGDGSKIMSNYLGDGTNRRNDLRFFTTASTTAAEKMRLDPDGNLGINTGAPSAKLHVVKGPSDLTPAIIESLPVFNDNTAAASLPVGGLYRKSTGELMVRY